MMRWLVLLVTGLFSTAAFAEGVADSLFAEANGAYEAGDYELAIETYEAVLAEGAWDGHVLYNLGNAHHKAGDLGRAILSYERAARIIPRSQDLRENLSYLRVLCKDRVEDASNSTVMRVFDRLLHILTADEAGSVFMTLWILLGLLVSLRILARPDGLRRMLGRAGVGCGVLCILSAIHLGLLWAEIERNDGIVTAEEVEIRSGPGDEYVTEFKLHAGSRVTIQRRAGAWMQVALSEELRGWCQAEAVEPIRQPD